MSDAMRSGARNVSATFSLVALDSATGFLGSSVASRYLGVGGVVPHLMRGVGAFNTQHCHHHRLAEQGLMLMSTGIGPRTAIKMVLAEDDMPERRQMLAIDTQGRKGAWTGEACAEAHHHLVGETCVAAGNTLAGASVVEAMVAYVDSRQDEPFGLRLIRALEAGEAEGGDHRGKQAAAVTTIPAGLEVWESEYVDLRVDDSEDPLAELMRMYALRWQGKR